MLEGLLPTSTSTLVRGITGTLVRFSGKPENLREPLPVELEIREMLVENVRASEELKAAQG